MRKSTPRHWLHAVLDLLPVLLIPVFMIYSQRHDINNLTAEVNNVETYSFQQYVKNGKPTSDLANIIKPTEISSSYTYYSNNGLYMALNQFTNGNGYARPVFNSQLPITSADDVIFVKFDILTSYGSGTNLQAWFNDSNSLQTSNSFNLVIDSQPHTYMFLRNGFGYSGSNINAFRFVIPYGYGVTISNVQAYNLTLIFGSGNEPLSAEDFDNYLTDDYYDFGVDYSFDVVNTIIYNDSDIGSQFIYQLYNVTDKYFNMSNVFGMNDVYKWFVSNIFNGNVPLVVPIVWNIILYEFILDLLFLLYGLFMWFIDMLKALIEKPIRSIK